jgi:hypothetical protein
MVLMSELTQKKDSTPVEGAKLDYTEITKTWFCLVTVLSECHRFIGDGLLT